MINKVLIANRGEIACRIISSIQSAGLDAVAVYSDADADALFVGLADESVALGGNTSAESYLDMTKIIDAAIASGADAIHPGYGFLSENAKFSALCQENQIQFIGPSAEAIEIMGNKAQAKQKMLASNVPCIPGYQGGAQDNATLLVEAKKIGYPIMVKASAGGGGRGIRLVHAEVDLTASLDSARTEALNSFGSGELILEKAVIDGRHIEVQIAADRHGNVVHLFERDCSAQRRHQKVIEEAPSPFCNESLRSAMGETAINAARAVSYEGVGTIEFLVDASGEYYFLEMNTRLQVEHPVTEMITGIDLVDWQLQIAEGKPLPLGQDDIRFEGHAIEVRIYAEDPDNNFMPQTGVLKYFEPSSDEGIRIDHGIYSGANISPYYDAMLAKLIAWGRTREEARRRLIRALKKTRILGLTTNKGFLVRLLSEVAFVSGETTTAFIDEALMLRIKQNLGNQDLALASVLLARMPNDDQTADGLQGFSNVAHLPRTEWLSDGAETFKVRCLQAALNTYSVTVCGDKNIDAEVISIDQVQANDHEMVYRYNGVTRQIAFDISGTHISLDLGDRVINLERETYKPVVAADEAGSGIIKAATEGLVIDVLVESGDKVSKGDTLLVVEAMKMEHRLLADADGVVKRVLAEAGQQVKNRQILVELLVDELSVDELSINQSVGE